MRLSADNLHALINDILNVTGLEAEQPTLCCRQYSLRRCIEEVVRMQQPAIAEKCLTIDQKIAPTIPDKLTGDPSKIQLILSRLLANALKFTDSGGIVVTAGLEQHCADTMMLDIAVTDTGIGIAPEKSAYIFDLFTQADESFTRRHGGLGLGLPICRKLAELMGGSITVESEEGKGSTFRLLLPGTPVCGNRFVPLGTHCRVPYPATGSK